MKLIVGLGNPGNEYNFTRHNTGFLALDFFLKANGLAWERRPKFSALCVRSGDVIFLKPQTFYNDSGIAILQFAKFYKIKSSDILVVCDDFNLPFGTIRERQKGSDGGNNGLKSTISNLKTEDFPRIRIGTGNDLRAKIGDVDFVLSKYSTEEKAELPTVLANVAQKISEFIERK